jgi:hypothetical protein
MKAMQVKNVEGSTWLSTKCRAVYSSPLSVRFSNITNVITLTLQHFEE